MVLTDHKLLTAASALMLTAGIIGFSSARNSASMCNDKAFYGEHVRKCDRWFEFGIWPRRTTHVAYHHPRPREEFPPVVSYDAGEHQQSITVRRDPQASNDFRSDGYIALQTADDVAKEPAYGFAGWFVSMFDMGRKHPPIFEAPGSQVRARVAHVATPRPIPVHLDK